MCQEEVKTSPAAKLGEMRLSAASLNPSSGEHSEFGEGGPLQSALVRSIDHGLDSTILAQDDEINANDVQEDNNNDEGMMDNNRAV